CKHWFHVLHLNTNSGKMSKSSGEFLTVSLLESKGYSPMAYRFFCMQSHYRKSLVFSYENLDNAAQAYQKLLAKIAALQAAPAEAVDEAVKAEYLAQYREAMDNDLNTAQAITVLYDVLKAKTNAATKLACIAEMDTVLSLGLLENAKALAAETAEPEAPAEVLALAEERKAARQAKDFARADALRAEIQALGWEIRETRQGVSFEKKA
ncbi:MAG: cysteine--tRNA ligase, partial [Oscillospiraceae bacterium]|nr:cysteine--tRNA ligase [Oscillospiraceae bacterium]